MVRLARVVGVIISLVLGSTVGTHAGRMTVVNVAAAQGAAPKPRPKLRGRLHKLTIDSSPQQATVFWDASTAKVPADPKAFGVAGYTPLTITVPRGTVKLIIELKGFKTIERELNVQRTEKQTFTFERAPEAGRLDVRASAGGNATGGEVFLDGVSVGTVPNEFQVAAGRRMLEIKKPGFETFSEWVDLKEGEHRTREVTLKRDASGLGSIMVVADSGDVYLDGEKKDAAPTLLAGVTPGDHVVEVRRDGAEPFRQVVKVEEGKQAKVTAGAAQGLAGSVRVLANVDDVDVYLDGRASGKTPADLVNVAPGQHVVEGRKKGFTSSEEVIKLTPGEKMMVRLKLEKSNDTATRAVLSVKSAEPNAEVFLDGASLGNAPIERKDLEPGKHVVIVRKPGFVDYKREVMLEEGKPMNMVAELQSVARLKFISQPPGAQVFIDGEPIPGVTPNSRDEVSAGEHQIMMRLANYVDNRQTIKVEGGKERIVSMDLEHVRVGPTRQEVDVAKTGASSFGAKALPRNGFAADLGTGFPYLLSGRLTVSAAQLPNTPIKLDAGVEIKTYFNMIEFALHSRAQLFQAGPLFLGVRGYVGGGPGSNGRNTFSTEVGPVATLSFADRVNFTVHAKYQYYTDKLCPSAGEVRRGVEPREACMDWTNTTNPVVDGKLKNSLFQQWNQKDPGANRYSGNRLFVGGALEVAVDRYFSGYVTVDFLPGQFEGRKAFKDFSNSLMFERDPLFYLTAGLTLKL
ncbi:MAG: PEGA domain-containing protein [Deltaproteobacteria bacterium]|nr:PEGA domain-containing protein [Deltaproteobacteria bacterium]